MEENRVTIEVISAVEKHPKADRLMIYTVAEYKVISSNLEDGSPRYNVGDFVIYAAPDIIVPEYLLKDGWWDDENNKGILGGDNGDVVTASKIRGVISEGIMFPTRKHTTLSFGEPSIIKPCVTNKDGEYCIVHEGMDVTDFLGFKTGSNDHGAS